MGGRGASSGMSDKGKPYGTEFRSVLAVGNIKFVKNNGGSNAKSPLETMTKGRIYVTVNERNELNSIDFYDEKGLRKKSINLLGHEGKDYHVHLGYYHNEYGDERAPNKYEKEIIDKVYKIWHNKNASNSL